MPRHASQVRDHVEIALREHALAKKAHYQQRLDRYGRSKRKSYLTETMQSLVDKWDEFLTEEAYKVRACVCSRTGQQQRACVRAALTRAPSNERRLPHCSRTHTPRVACWSTLLSALAHGVYAWPTGRWRT